MARGSASKEKIVAKILETFPGSFVYEKDIRIPMVENGETIQIKVSLTAAKVNVASGADVALPGAEAATSDFGTTMPTTEVAKDFMNEPTAEEKESVKKLLQTLGITTV